MGIAGLGLAGAAGAKAELSVEQILERYTAARGGLETLHAVHTMVWTGHIQSGNAAAAGTTFTMSFKRPNMTRFEIRGPGQMAVHIYDGMRGWKVRQVRGGSPDLQDYTPEELSFARDALGIDGPLIDHKAKGVVVTLGGVEEIEGHKAYRLNLTLPSGAQRRAWIDARTFLEERYDREAGSSGGHPGTVSVDYRNYQTFAGVQIPLLIETGSGTGKAFDRMFLDRVVINTPLSNQLFAKPRLAERSPQAPH
jgi:outer membrane lipoprotein-sorting protein